LISREILQQYRQICENSHAGHKFTDKTDKLPPIFGGKHGLRLQERKYRKDKL